MGSLLTIQSPDCVTKIVRFMGISPISRFQITFYIQILHFHIFSITIREDQHVISFENAWIFFDFL